MESDQDQPWPDFNSQDSSREDDSESGHSFDDHEANEAERLAVPVEILKDAPPAGAHDMPMMRLHPVSLAFDLISHGRTYLVPILFGLFGAANGNVTLLIISGLVFIPAVLVSVFRFFTLRYRIESDHLVVTQGLVFRKTRSVPVSRIQNVDLVQNLMHRAFRVAEVKIETASGTEPEATLRVLSMRQIELLREAIFSDRETGAPPERSAANALRSSIDAVPSDGPAAPELVHSISLGRLIQAGLASNRGLILVGIVLGAYFQFGDDQYEKAFQQAYALVPVSQDYLWNSLIMVGVLLATLVALRLLGIGWFILRFFDYRLERRGQDMRISCGLLTRVSATVPRDRIQFISVHQNLLMRWMKLASIRIETAGGSGEQQDATQAVSKRWFVPVISEGQVAPLIALLRPDLTWAPESFEFRPLSPRAGSRMMRRGIVLSLLAAGAGMAVYQPWGWAAGLIVLPVMILWTRRRARSMKYARLSMGVVYRSGVLTRKTSVTFFDKIQTLRLDQTPFDRRWGMARLTVDTAAAGPAGHLVTIPYLDAGMAETEFCELRSLTSLNQPVFG